MNMKEKTAYDDIVKLFKKCVTAYAKGTGQTKQESVEILLPAVLKQIEKALRNSIKL